jgi:hypothetical protein
MLSSSAQSELGKPRSDTYVADKRAVFALNAHFSFNRSPPPAL